jgi:hypothetical protein
MTTTKTTNAQRVEIATEWLSYDSAMSLREIANLGLDGAAEHGLKLYENDDQHGACALTLNDMRDAYRWIVEDCRRHGSHDELVAAAMQRIADDETPADALKARGLRYEDVTRDVLAEMYDELQNGRTSSSDACSRCSRLPTPDEIRAGWPVVSVDGMICPSCFGDDAWCSACGELLLARVDTARCQACIRRATADADVEPPAGWQHVGAVELADVRGEVEPELAEIADDKDGEVRWHRAEHRQIVVRKVNGRWCRMSESDEGRERADGWISTDASAIRDDVARLGMLRAAEYQLELIEDRTAAGDDRWSPAPTALDMVRALTSL